MMVEVPVEVLIGAVLAGIGVGGMLSGWLVKRQITTIIRAWERQAEVREEEISAIMEAQLIALRMAYAVAREFGSPPEPWGPMTDKTPAGHSTEG